MRCSCRARDRTRSSSSAGHTQCCRYSSGKASAASNLDAVARLFRVVDRWASGVLDKCATHTMVPTSDLKCAKVIGADRAVLARSDSLLRSLGRNWNVPVPKSSSAPR